MPFTIKSTVSEDDRHLKDVVTIIFHQGKLFSGGEDGIVKMWDADLHRLAEVQAHEVNVYHMAAIDDTLYTCSNDGTIQAWFIENLQPKKTLLKFEDEVWRLYADSDKLYSGDNKGMVGVFEDDTCKLMYNLLEEIEDLIVKNNIIYSVRDRDVAITEMTGNTGRYVTRVILEGRHPMSIVGTKLCFASRSGVDILVHDNNKLSCFKEVAKLEQAHDMIINTMCAGDDERTIYTGGYDKKVKRWDLETKQCVAECELGYCVNAICMGDQGQIYAAGPNGVMCSIDNN